MLQNFFRPNYIFNNDAYFLDFRAQKFPLIFFNINPFKVVISGKYKNLNKITKI